MNHWRFVYYHTEDRGNLVRSWYATQDDQVRAAFDGVLALLRATEDWDDPDLYAFKEFKTGQYVGLSELRFSIKKNGKVKKRFRPLGLWRPAAREFILILVCEKSGRIKIPPDAFELAFRYKSEIEQSKGMIYDRI